MWETIVSFLTSLGLYSLLLVTGFWLWFQWSHRELLRAAAKIPVSLPTIPLIGHAYLTLWDLEDLSRYVLELTLGAVSKGIKTTCIWCGPLPMICLQDMADIQVVINGSNNSDKPEEYDYIISGMDSGVGAFHMSLLTARGETWKVTRKHINPLFHPRNIQHLIPVFNTNSRELVERMSHHVGQGPFNVLEYTMDVSLKTVCNLVFGPEVDVDVNTEAFKGLMFFVETIPELFIVRVLRPWLRNEFLFRLFYWRTIKQLSTCWRNFTNTPMKVAKNIQKQKTTRENSLNMTENNENSSSVEEQERLNFFDVYTILQKNYPEFREADLIGEILTLYCTGTDTVGAITASCLLALAQYQDIQERLYQEICTVVGSEEDITLEHLYRIPYLEMVLNETLRRFMIVPYLMRKITKEVALSDCVIPAGTSVICNLAAIHMDPKIYPNPTKFDPERFSPENSASREKFAYIPFSGGPRICIAKTYAMQLIKIKLIHVLREYRLSTTQDIHNLRKKVVITLISADGYHISLESRNADNKLMEDD